MSAILDEDAILNSPVVYSEAEVLAEFQESCEAEAETPHQHTERLRLAALDLCQMLERQNRAVQAKKKRLRCPRSWNQCFQLSRKHPFQILSGYSSRSGTAIERSATSVKALDLSPDERMISPSGFLNCKQSRSKRTQQSSTARSPRLMRMASRASMN